MEKSRYSQTVQWYAKRAWNVASQREINWLKDDILGSIDCALGQERKDLVDLYGEFIDFLDLSLTEEPPMPIMESVLPD